MSLGQQLSLAGGDQSKIPICVRSPNNIYSTIKIPNNRNLFPEFSFVKIRGRKCIQFTDDRDGTKYALKVVNEMNIAFKVS